MLLVKAAVVKMVEPVAPGPVYAPTVAVAIVVVAPLEFKPLVMIILVGTNLLTSKTTIAVSPQNIIMHRNAFTLAVADLELPEGVHFAGRASDKEIGLSMRVVRQYTINNDSIPTRLDVLYGWAPLYPELACRVAA